MTIYLNMKTYLMVFFLGTPISSTNKTDRNEITEILFKVSLNTITLTLTVHILINKAIFNNPNPNPDLGVLFVITDM